MEVIQAINARRTIRRYKDKPVSPEILAAVLDAARQAPSWANSQTWRFIIIKDKELRLKLAALFPHNRGAGALAQAPAVIVSCAELNRAGWLRGEKKSDKSWHLFDLGSALENLVLAATSLGLSTVHIGNFEQAKVAELLEVPAGYEVELMTALGYPDEEPAPKARKELKELSFRNKFGQPYFE
jgi:nitroreductase